MVLPCLPALLLDHRSEAVETCHVPIRGLRDECNHALRRNRPLRPLGNALLESAVCRGANKSDRIFLQDICRSHESCSRIIPLLSPDSWPWLGPLLLDVQAETLPESLNPMRFALPG